MSYGKAHLEERPKRVQSPRLFLLAVEEARLFPDGASLSVYVEALAHAEGRLVAAIKRRVRLKCLPRLEFVPWRAGPS